MIPDKFKYYKPNFVTEAISMLQDHGEEAKLLAGGHSLIPMMKLRLATPAKLIDLNNLSELSYIRETDGYLRIGAMTREFSSRSSITINCQLPYQIKSILNII